MRDRYYGTSPGMNGPIVDADEVTPSDDENLTGGVTRFLYVGKTGDLTVMFNNGKVVTLKDAAVGYHPLRALRVMETGTTADDIVALY